MYLLGRAREGQAPDVSGEQVDVVCLAQSNGARISVQEALVINLQQKGSSISAWSYR